MLLEFKREAYNYLTDLPERDDFLEWLGLARHYGMPSRLVDFSYSFYVAAYFALSMKKKDELGWILAINLTWVKDELEKKLI
ncbi:MAG: FRG domain-containing protein, partial [Sedimentisphaerales bacterium]|nr:FRG domain-containing protein [Sedimentisphaerales bacterium]